MIHRHLGPVARVAVLALLLVAPSAASAQIAVTPSVSGPNITLSWSPVGGADTYAVVARLAPAGAPIATLPATATGFSIAAPATGTFYLQVLAGAGATPVAQSEVFPVTVTSLVATPVNLEAYSYCGGVLLRWANGGGNVSGYLVNVPGVGTIPSAGTQIFAPSAPAGGYSFSVTAVGPGGSQSAPSASVPFTITAGAGTVPTPIVTTSVFGTYVSASWSPVPGATSYTVSPTVNGAPLAPVPVPAGVTSLRQMGIQFLGLGTYGLSVTANVSCGGTSAAGVGTLVVDGAPPPGPRTPNPAPGTRLPLPGYARDVVNQIAAARPDWVINSCHETGGNNRFMFEVVKELRKRDTRWGLNWKRGNFGDLSQDIVTYNAGPDPDEGARSPFIYIVDMIGGHCGPRPGPNWEDVTQLTAERGAIGIWTLLPYVQAGYTP